MNQARVGTAALGALLLSGLPAMVQAADIRWNGFLDAAGAVSDTEEGAAYLGRIDQDGDFGDTTFGLNLNALVNDEFRVAAQLTSNVTTELHTAGGEEGRDVQGAQQLETVNLDWAVGHYEPNQHVTVRFGKLPFLARLISDHKKVGYTYPWIRPPQVVYGSVYYSPALGLDAIKGASAAFGDSIGGVDYEFTVYGGSGRKVCDHDKMHAVRLDLGTDNLNLYAGYNRSQTHTDQEPFNQFIDGEWIQLMTGGGRYDNGKLLAYAEFMRNSPESKAPMGKGKIDLMTDAWYATLGYRLFNRKLMPHVTYSKMAMYDANWGQEAWTTGLRYELRPGMALKAEWQAIQPQGFGIGLDGGDEDEVSFASSPGEADRPYRYAGLTAGTTSEDPINVYSLAVNVLF